MPDFARAQLRRQRANFALFLGPALVLLACFFVAPVIVDLGSPSPTWAASSRSPSSRSRTSSGCVTRDTRLLASLGITAIFVLSTLAIFNVTFALLLALATTALPQGLGAFFRAVWLLPRMSPSVVYALLWIWVVDPNRLRAAQPDPGPRARPAAARPEEQRADAADHPRQRLHRRLVRHDHLHLRHPLDPRASVPCRARRRRRRARHHPPRHAAGDPLADLASSRSTRRSRCW